jgi:tRNA1Val (adenine37-N6)-methyltransferase
MKSNTHFHFKQFSVRHDRCSMKVGTDAVLLGAWVDVRDIKSVLEVGAGSGIISLMIAQRTSPVVKIDAVEIERGAAEQAVENILQSPWPSRIVVHPVAIQDFFPPEQYDMIICNPPFFNNSLKPPDKGRLQVRHTTSLTFEDLVSAAVRLLKSSGKLSVILPEQEGILFSEIALSSQLYNTRKHSFRTRSEKPIERWLLEFSKHKSDLEDGKILLYKGGLEWSELYKNLTKDFYLKI